MKIRWAAAALLTLCASGACAQELPGTDCFSPGLAAVMEAVQAGKGLHVTATVGVDSALYARDLSVLADMLAGTEFSCDSTAGRDALCITRGGETIFSGAVEQAEDAVIVELNGEAYRVQDAQTVLSALTGVPVQTATPDEALTDAGVQAANADKALMRAPTPSMLTQLPLADVAAWLETLEAGTRLAGLTLEQPVALERTLSEDGTRVTKLGLAGALTDADGAVWSLSGTLQQTGAAKTTAEITAALDKDNTFTLTLTSTRKSTVTRRDKAGQAQVDTVLKSSGRLAGNSITTQLTLRLRNDWTADGEALTEKIVLSAELGHTDKTPGRRMQRLNDLNIKLRQAITMTTREADGPLELSDSVTLDFKMDGTDFAVGSAKLAVRVGGGQTPAAVAAQPREADAKTLREAVQEAVIGIAQGIWAQMSESQRGRITNGL